MSRVFELQYPDVPGHKTSGPSERAAQIIAGTTKTLRDQVLRTFAAAPGGLTADQVASRLNRSILSMRPRVSELHRLGEIKQATNRGKNAFGMSATVWIISPSIAADQTGGGA